MGVFNRNEYNTISAHQRNEQVKVSHVTRVTTRNSIRATPSPALPWRGHWTDAAGVCKYGWCRYRIILINVAEDVDKIYYKKHSKRAMCMLNI